MTCFGVVKYFLLWTLLLCIISWTNGSSGDRSEPFQRCLTRCLGLCKRNNAYPGKLPVLLMVFGWKCSDECKYTCMHKVTQRAIVRGWKIEQFYGKVGHKLEFIEHNKNFFAQVWLYLRNYIILDAFHKDCEWNGENFCFNSVS